MAGNKAKKKSPKQSPELNYAHQIQLKNNVGSNWGVIETDVEILVVAWSGQGKTIFIDLTHIFKTNSGLGLY